MSCPSISVWNLVLASSSTSWILITRLVTSNTSHGVLVRDDAAFWMQHSIPIVNKIQRPIWFIKKVILEQHDADGRHPYAEKNAWLNPKTLSAYVALHYIPICLFHNHFNAYRSNYPFSSPRVCAHESSWLFCSPFKTYVYGFHDFFAIKEIEIRFRWKTGYKFDINLSPKSEMIWELLKWRNRS